MWQKVIKDKRILGGLALLLVLAAVPLTLTLTKNQQDIRQRAAETTPAVCSTNQPANMMLIFDSSGSMKDPTSATDPTTRLKSAQTAATSFVDKVSVRTETPKSMIGFVSFSSETSTSIRQALTQNYAGVKAAIASVSLDSDTCVECGIKAAETAFKQGLRPGIRNVAVLLSDGGATRYIGSRAPYTTATHTEAEKRSVDAAVKTYNENGVAYYVIGFGTDVREDFLKEIAAKTGGKYYFAPDAATLNSVYAEISSLIGKGTISGVVYNDVNGNKIQDTAETGQAGWKVDLLNATNQVVATTTSGDQGNYSFAGICDGTYKAKVTVQSGWSITTPVSSDYLSVTVTKGSVVTDQNFGAKQVPIGTTLSCSPLDIMLTSTNQAITATLTNGSNAPVAGKTITWTVTGGTAQLSAASSTTNATGVATTNILAPAGSAGFTGTVVGTYTGDTQSGNSTCSVTTHFAPQATSLTVTVFLHGIGNSGDNVNSASSLSNKTPIHTTRNLIISIYDTKDNKLVKEVSNNSLAYNSAQGNYSAAIDLGSNFPTGSYLVQVKTDYHLRKQFPGAIQINTNQNTVLTPITLVAGDVDNANQIDIRDYNALIDCYSDFQPPVACDEDKKLSTDLNDDGKVEQFDYNLLLREWLVQNGDTVGI